MDRKRHISIILALMLVFVYMPVSIFALSGSSTVIIKEGQKLNPDDYHSSKRTTYIAETYNDVDGAHTEKSVYYFNIPKKGTFILDVASYGTVVESYAGISGVKIDVRNKKQIKNEEDGGIRYICNTEKAGRVKVELTQYMKTKGSGQTALNMVYIEDSTKTLTAKSGWKTYIHGATGDPTKTSNYKIKIPAKGYLIMELTDAADDGDIIHAKTTGMNYETFSGVDTRKYIGVKKGTYMFNVKTNAAYYKVRYKFVKVNEGAYGTSKAKAKSLKKGTSRKGVIIVNGKVSKKVHWYKFKLNKNSNTQVTVKSLINSGGGYEGLNVSIYGKDGLIKSGKIRPGDKENTYVLSSKDLYGKLKKGTYYIKIRNASKGNGYFAVGWK